MRTNMIEKMKKTRKAVYSILIAALVFGSIQITAFAGSTLVWPVPASYNITQGFHDNNAIDIGAAEGSTIVAAMGGTVKKTFTCTQTHHNYGDCNGFGTGVVIAGDDGRTYQYAHMQGGSIPSNVYVGARVSAGQQIGRVGQTGYAYGAHLHFGISNSANYWEAGPNPANETYGTPSANISVGNQKAENISNTNAKISATLYKAPGINCSCCGVYLGTSRTNMTKRNTEGVGSASNNYNGGKSFNIWYDLTGELGIKLNPGTTYYYQIYAMVNGKEYRTPVATFKTTGTAPKAQTVTTKKTNKITASNLSRYASTKKQTVNLNVKRNGSGKITYKSLTKGVSVSAAGKVTIPKNFSGKAKIRVTVAADKNYYKASKDITITVNKLTQPLKLRTANKVYSVKTLKKKGIKFFISTKNAKGKVTYKSNSKYIKVVGNMVTVKKGTPKGTYKITVRAAGNKVYKAGSKVLTIVVR